jgi:two-component sensor histidine kinase
MRSLQIAGRSSNRRGIVSVPKIELESAADTLRFRCPNTGREVDSGISARRSTRLISIRVRCPVCENLHEWQVADESPGSRSSADNHSNGLREQLLDELDHRLKNNLQMLYGFLEIARQKTYNAEAREVLSDTSRRIGAMGTAQHVFYSVGSSTDVSGQRLVRAVCANARAFFTKDVSIYYEATANSLPKETAIPLALALNELLTNAAKYGADDCGRVTVNVGLSQPPGEIVLSVQDQGLGFNFEDTQRRSSGLALVMTLAQRLKGTFTVERRSGARCVLRFPDR